MGDENMKAFQLLNRRKTRYVFYRMDEFNIVVDKIAERNTTYLDMVRDLPETEPRYIVYDFEFKSADGRLTSKMFWIFWTPKNASQEKRVIYTQGLSKFRDQFSGTTNLSFSTAKEFDKAFETEYIDKVGYTVTQKEPVEEDIDEDFD